MLEAAVTTAVLVVAWLIWLVVGLTTDRRKDAELRAEIQNGVVKANAEADSSINGTDLDKRVREKYNRRG